MKRFLKFLKWTGITLGTLFVLFIAINAFDETLDPGAAAIINAQPKIKPEENAYLFLVGLRAPPDRAPGEFGQECITRLINISKSHKETVALFSSGKTGCTDEKPWLAGQDISAISCGRQQVTCLSHYQKQSVAIKQLAETNQILLQRYEQLLAMEYFEDVPYTNHMTTPLPFDSTSELYSAVSAIKLQEGNAGAFIQRTTAEAKFYRMVLHGNSGLVSKLLALIGVNRAAGLVSDAVREYPTLAREHQAALLTISQPLTVVERSLESAMMAELREVASSFALGATAEEATFFDRLFVRFVYKYNATLNRYYRGLPGWRDLSQLPTEQYLAAEKIALTQLTDTWRDGYLHFFYNPMGKMLAEMASPAYSDYPRRIIDFDGRQRVISLQIQIAAQKIPESDIPAFLKNADPQFRDPYTGQPMQWDKSRGLYFRGHSDRITDKDGFISVKL